MSMILFKFLSVSISKKTYIIKELSKSDLAKNNEHQ